MRLNQLFITIILAFAASSTNADTLSNVNNFLSSSDVNLDDLKIEGDKIQQLPKGINKWIERVQVSVDNRDDFETTKASRVVYRLNLKPKASGQSKAENQILTLQSQLEAINYRKLENAAFNWRYREFLNLVLQIRQLQNVKAIYDVTEKEVVFHRNLVNSNAFNESALLNAELLLDQTKGLIALHENRLKNTKSKLNIPINEKEYNPLKWLIDLNEIQKFLESTDEIDRNPDVQAANLALAEAKAKYTLNKTEQNLGVDSLRFQVIDNQNANRPTYGFMVGVNIPLGEHTFKNIQGSHDIYDAQMKLYNSKATLKQTLLEKRNKMQEILEEYTANQKQIEKIEGRLEKDYAKTNPRIALYLKTQYNKVLNEQLTLQQNALNLYLEYLTTSGLLTAEPLRNWFHKDFVKLTAENTQ